MRLDESAGSTVRRPIPAGLLPDTGDSRGAWAGDQLSEANRLLAEGYLLALRIIMASLRKSIPSLPSLIAFEAAARLQSFTRAAEELRLTQAAISRQIRELEIFLQVPLFERGYRSIELTPAGLLLNSSLPAHLNAIASLSDRVREFSNPQAVVVGMTHAFGTYWLAPRLAEFSTANPDVDLRLAVNDELVDITKQRIDMTIRYGDGAWPAVSSRFLMGSEVMPVCHPAYWQGRERPSHPSQLLGEKLIGLEGPPVFGNRWSEWFAFFGVDAEEGKFQITVNNFSVLVQALLSGHGIALGGNPLLDDIFASGMLVPAIEVAPFRVRGGYYIVEPLGQTRKRNAERFSEWLYERVRRDAALNGNERLLVEAPRKDP
ncbi:LysR substrate-binding domain-containing protein [Mesorhizobium sp. LHD-90]|uniref:LysR substrate-binding domain-containing protein n=1 Tax=Mesorhizobium sp. LHD-90 TaxID=3071414 RepID=UPI0027E117A4|nr:LysR substrate-binding domain-containing protein [Mesorhizobium sp. LHD-90]MDQ6434115.1 LysR substrate-binding domain-containing protein [Mesorhizobium sp. LHD-90]